MDITNRWNEAVEWLDMYSELRAELLAELRDQDLAFTLPGSNPSLGALFVEMGEVELSYLESFNTFRQSFEHRQLDQSLTSDVDALRAWLQELDDRLFSCLNAFPIEEAEGRKIHRGEDFQVDPVTQIHFYREALLIFYGKVSTYLKAIDREVPGRWKHWIG